MCLAQRPQHSDAGEAGTRGPSVSSQALYHWATVLPSVSKQKASNFYQEIPQSQTADQATALGGGDAEHQQPHDNKNTIKVKQLFSLPQMIAKLEKTICIALQIRTKQKAPENYEGSNIFHWPNLGHRFCC